MQLVAVTVLLGVLALRLVVLPRFGRQDGGPGDIIATAGPRALGWARAAIGAIGIATVLRLAAQHAAMFGTEEHWSRATIGALLLQSGWGRGWWLALAGVLAGWWATGAVARRRGFAWPVLAAGAVALVVSLSLSGHPVAAERPVLAVAIDALHVIGAGGWVGSLAMLIVVAVPVAMRSAEAERHGHVARLVTAFSPTALGFAGLAALTGTLAAWRNIDTLAALWSSGYGQRLLAKLAMLSVAAGTGAYNWKRVLPALGTAPATRRLRGSATIELVAALVVLVITAVLVATPLPAEIAKP
ncbi:MAG: CopD family protein [Gemmatimonadetes bacterium]|nr:CopD family protein [Gemmatimonadota bacterium]